MVDETQELLDALTSYSEFMKNYDAMVALFTSPPDVEEPDIGRLETLEALRKAKLEIVQLFDKAIEEVI
jgi:hypothetical protein